MPSLSIIKKIKFYNLFKKMIKKNNKIILTNNFLINRRYKTISKVIEVPNYIYPSTYEINSVEKNRILTEYLDNKIYSEMRFLQNNGFSEIIKIYYTTKINDNNYLVTYGYRFLNSVKYILFKYLSLGIGLITLIGILFF